MTNRDQKIEKVLSSVEGIAPAEPLPFLSTRIRARMNREPSGFWSGAARLIARPMVALSIVAIVTAADMISVNRAKTTASNFQLKSSKYDFTVSANGIYDPENNDLNDR